MYSITTTPGFIIDSRTIGEADKHLTIFTRDLGLIRAIASGIRYEKSKLRYHVADFSFGSFSFVRGKEIWRLTNAEEFNSQNLKPGDLELLARLALLLRRLLHGEEPNPQLFDQLYICVRYLGDKAVQAIEMTEMQSQTLESLIVIRILHSLGYVGNDKEVADCFMTDENGLFSTSDGLLADLAAKKALINKHINKALKESHL